MLKSRLFCGLVACCLCLAIFPSFAGTAKAETWPVYKGSFRSYFMANLPLPFVIYKYDAGGKLAGIFIASKFRKHPGGMHPTADDRAYTYGKMRQFVISGDVAQPSQQELATYAASLKAFTSDQGYDLGSLIDHTKTYTLILAEADTSKTTCKIFLDARDEHLNTVRQAIKDAPASHSYAVRRLIVGGPGFKQADC